MQAKMEIAEKVAEHLQKSTMRQEAIPIANTKKTILEDKIGLLQDDWAKSE